MTGVWASRSGWLPAGRYGRIRISKRDWLLGFGLKSGVGAPHSILVGAGLVDAFDAVDALDFADAAEDRFELAAIYDFQVYVDLGVEAVGAAFEIVDVAAGGAENRVMSARRPARSLARMRSWTRNLAVVPSPPHSTAMRRSVW